MILYIDIYTCKYMVQRLIINHILIIATMAIQCGYAPKKFHQKDLKIIVHAIVRRDCVPILEADFNDMFM